MQLTLRDKLPFVTLCAIYQDKALSEVHKVLRDAVILMV